ncbi:hypothetical protein Tco_0485363 [Tanacetum coccineum]
MITTRSGFNYNPPKNTLDDTNNSQDKSAKSIPNEKEAPNSQAEETLVPSIPKEQFKKKIENLQRLSINISFMEVLELMPKYAKFMKDLLAKKGRIDEASKITLNE